jgi:hypothetical protein
MATATARLRVTIGFGDSRSRIWYSVAICAQSVSSADGA